MLRRRCFGQSRGTAQRPRCCRSRAAASSACVYSAVAAAMGASIGDGGVWCRAGAWTGSESVRGRTTDAAGALIVQRACTRTTESMFAHHR